MIKEDTRVLTDNLMINMVLSRDVMSDAGIVLMSEHTMLNGKNIEKLKIYGIDAVYVQNDSAQEKSFKSPSPTVTLDETATLVRDTEDFLAFENEYEKKQEETASALLSIGNGNGVDTTSLYNIADETLGALQNKSDIFAYLTSLKQRGDHIFPHSINVSLLCNLFGSWLGISGMDLESLTVAGILHDIGNTKISSQILNKPGKLTEEEYEEIKKHPAYGYEILKDQPIDPVIKDAVLMHHERINGTGYPGKLKIDDIDSYARIVAIADVYDAMTNPRSYRGKICPFDVIKAMEQEFFGELDTEYLDILLKNIAYSYIGNRAILSNGEMGEVVFVNPEALSAPIVKIGNTFIDLNLVRDVKIVEMV